MSSVVSLESIFGLSDDTDAEPTHQQFQKRNELKVDVFDEMKNWFCVALKDF